MKNIFLISTVVFLSFNVFSQAPEKMSYQAVIRNSSDVLVTDTEIGMQISVLKGSIIGTPVYVELQNPTTNLNGLFSIEIGRGITEDDFSMINWSDGIYFIKTETDISGGTNYSITGTSQLLSVPYALHAKTAENITGDINETDPTYSISEAANITSSDINNLNNLSGINTGDQNLSALASKKSLEDSIAQIRSEIPDLNGIDINAKAIKDSAHAIRSSMEVKQITTYFPQSANKSSNVLISFSGNSNVNFSQASPVALSFNQATPIFPHNIRYINNKKIDVEIYIPWDAATGTYDIIINPNDQDPNIIEKAFLIDWFR